MQKYGFVYIWYDRKHKRYYIGCHWGIESDGYICSSRWMRKSYRRRPEDFKRRIISRVYTNRNDLHKREHAWLSLINDNDLGNKYYNLTKHKNSHWSAGEEDRVISLKEKISTKTKEAMGRPEVKQKYQEGLKSRNTKSSDETVREKRKNSMIKTMSEKFPKENRRKRNTVDSEEYRQELSQKSTEMWNNRTTEDRHNIGSKISESLKASKKTRSIYISTLKWWNNGFINKRTAEQPGPEWLTGRKKKINDHKSIL